MPAGTIGEIKPKTITDQDGVEHHGQYFDVDNSNIGSQIFDFLAENTDVEWSHIESNNKRGGESTIATSHEEGVEYLGNQLTYDMLMTGSKVSKYTHSHPNNSPSIFELSTVSDDDKSTVKYFNDNFKGNRIIFRAYDVREGKYDYFNDKGVVKHEKKRK